MMIEATKRKVDQNKKSTISKLLATENIHVVHRKTKTASFNVATRELTLPIFKKELSSKILEHVDCCNLAEQITDPDEKYFQIHGYNRSLTINNKCKC